MDGEEGDGGMVEVAADGAEVDEGVFRVGLVPGRGSSAVDGEIGDIWPGCGASWSG